jgi:hypothetical protein
MPSLTLERCTAGYTSWTTPVFLSPFITHHSFDERSVRQREIPATIQIA